MAVGLALFVGQPAAAESTASAPEQSEVGRVPGMSSRTRDQVLVHQASKTVGQRIDVIAPPLCPGPWCWEDPQPNPEPQAQGERVIFLNFDGVTLTSGGENSQQNRSTLINQSTINSPVIEPTIIGNGTAAVGWTLAEVKNYIADLVRLHMTPYNVRVVTDRPSGGNYHMVVFSPESNCGSITVSGPGGCVGLARLDCDDDNLNNIVFAFVGGQSLIGIGTTASHEVGHSIGLHHTVGNDDIMFPTVSTPAPTAFTSGDIVSGEGGCRFSFQDSDGVMLDVIGPSAPDTTPPTVEIARPAEGLEVGGAAIIEIQTEDLQSAIGGVDLYLNDQLFRSAGRDERPFEFVLPPSTPEGPLTVRAVVRNVAGLESSASVNISFKRGGAQPCVDNMDCSAFFQVCDGTQCISPDPSMPLPGALGATCVGDADCNQGFCGTLDGESFCSQSCDDQTPCPDGFFCRGGGACWPNDSSGGGCGCSSSGNESPLFGLLMFIVIVVCLRRRTR